MSDAEAPVQIGDKIQFLPACFIGDVDGNGSTVDIFGAYRGKVTGTVSYINLAHRFYRVSWTTNGITMHECMKF